MIRLTNGNQLSAALREVVRVTQKTEAEIVTKAAKDVAFRSAQFTPKTSAAKIRADLRKDDLLSKLASRWLKKTKGVYTRAEHEEAMRKIERARLSHRNAVRVGWFPAIIQLGGKIRGSKDDSFSHLGSAARGSGKKATTGNMVSTVENAIFTRSNDGRKTWGPGIPQAVRGLAKAIAFVTRDRLQYAEKKLREKLRKFN